MKNKGFTLIELCFMTAILAIFMALFLPKIQQHGVRVHTYEDLGK